MFDATPQEKAYAGPLILFLGFLLLGEAILKASEWLSLSFGLDSGSHWALSAPLYWIYPLQTAVCAAFVWRMRRHYVLGFPSRPIFTLFVAIIVFAVWITPSLAIFGGASRAEGFNPWFFGGQNAASYASIALRFIRLVIVVPLVEEIFWRGFLLRYLIDTDFTSVKFGTLTRNAFLITTAGFCIEHQFSDWPAAIIAGMLYNLVAWRTRSLSSCIFAHAATNLLLGLYIMKTQQWGYW